MRAHSASKTRVNALMCAPYDRSGGAAVRDGKRGRLVGLERDLLRQHDVADGKMAFGHEAPDRDTRAARIQFVDVHLGLRTDAITLAAGGAGHLETAEALELCGLRGRQPLLEQDARLV